MFVIHAETVIQLEADTHAVVDALVVTTIHVLNAVTHEVRLDGFHRVLTDWEFVPCEVFNTPRVARKVVVNRHFLVVRKFWYQPPPAEKVQLSGVQLSAVPTIFWS